LLKYIFLFFGVALLIVSEIFYLQKYLSFSGLILLITGLYLLSKKIPSKKIYDPFQIKSVEEEE
tara:strand:+ start:103 stop:294 length:192 start_codon:yes stop_codon:yes gene_type:complete